MKKDINFLFSCDSGYAIPLTVCTNSIFENHKENKVNIFVFYSTLSEDQKGKLIGLAYQYNQKINLIHINERYFNDVPVLRWTKETYYRLLINELLPESIERIIYLDCDIIVNKNLIELYYLDLGDNSIAALPEKNSLDFRPRLGLNKEGQYFQAGVILFDVKKTKEVSSYEQSINTIGKIGDKLIAVDQDVINVMFDGKIKEIDEKFNNCKITNFYNNNYYRLFNHTDINKIKDTYIFHYATGKPWNNLFSGACENIWYKYLILSPYQNLYKEKYNTLKYRVLRLGVSKLIFYEYIHLTPIIDSMMRKILSEKRYDAVKRFYRRNIK
jgi:lipopolysaccharide biosynthesis glycosyltransferase